MLWNWLAVGAGGALGALGRYGLGHLPGYYYLGFPLGTLGINFLGAFLIGVLSGLAPLGMSSARTELLFKTGFCGGFTTFSTFSLETMQLLEQERWIEAGVYAAGSVLICLAGVYLGRSLTAKLPL